MKNLFLFLSLSLSTQFVFAQKYSFGLKGGANVTDWYYTKTSNSQYAPIDFQQPYIGFDIGGTARQKLSQRFSLNEEILYSQRSISVDKKYFNGVTHYYKGGYIAIPLFVSYHFYKSISIDLGGEYSRIVKSTNFDFKRTFENENFISGIIGLRYQFQKYFDIHCRYTHNFSKMGEVTWTDFNANELGKSKQRAHTLSLAIGYNF